MRHIAPVPYYDEKSAYKCCCLPFAPLYAEILSHLACPKSENRNVPARASKSRSNLVQITLLLFLVPLSFYHLLPFQLHVFC